MPMPMPGMPSTPYLLAGAVVALVLVGLVGQGPGHHQRGRPT